MKPDEARMLAAINRNFNEANNAVLKFVAYTKLRSAGFPCVDLGFFTLAQQALFNDMVASAIRIFDEHKEAGSLWYIVRCNEAAAKHAAQACGISIDELRKLVPKLRYIRNRTHFHIDRRALENPSLVWSDADLSNAELSDALQHAALFLARIKQECYGGELEKPSVYDGSDIQQIVDAYTSAIAGCSFIQERSSHQT
jgi:hypothetical protein